jgi:hypothetical protein
MDRNNLPGLSPLWLISLAMVLGTAIVVLIPVSISSGDAIKASDWIGFAGNVAAGAMTLIAAAFAWFAVQRQIAAQEDIARQQIAAQRLSILQDRIATLEDDQRLAWDLRAAVRFPAFVVSTFLATPAISPQGCRHAIEALEREIVNLETLSKEFGKAGPKVASMNVAKLTRMKIQIAVRAIFRKEIQNRMILSSLNFPLSPSGGQMDAETPEIGFQSEIENAESICDEYIGSVAAEIFRLRGILNESAKHIGL